MSAGRVPAGCGTIYGLAPNLKRILRLLTDILMPVSGTIAQAVWRRWKAAVACQPRYALPIVTRSASHK